MFLFNIDLFPRTGLRYTKSISLDGARWGNRVEYTCSTEPDRPHPHSNQLLLHTARNSLLNFNSLSWSTAQMPWLVWQRRPFHPNSIENAFVRCRLSYERKRRKKRCKGRDICIPISILIPRHLHKRRES